MRRLPTLLILLLLGGAPAAADPPSDQVFLSKRITIDWRADGRQSTRIRTERKLLTDYAVRRLSDPRIRYDEDLQTLTIHEHKVRIPSGDEVVAPNFARNLSQADGIGNTTDFASVVELVATQVGARRDAVLILDYELTDREAFRPALDLAVPLGEAAPIRHLDVTVTVPEGSLLNWTLSPGDHGFSAESAVTNGSRVLRILAEDLPATPRESGGLNLTPRLLASTWIDWEHALDHLDGLLRTACEGHGTCGLPEALETSEDGSGLPAALRSVRNGLRILRGPLPGGLFRPRPVCRVWESGYATPLESAMVLATAAKASSGARLALSTGDATLAKTVPGLAQWTDVQFRTDLSMGWIPSTDTVHYPSGQLGGGEVLFDLSRPRTPGAGDTSPLSGHRPVEMPCRQVTEDRVYRATPGVLSLRVHVVLESRPDVWLELVDAKDLEDALEARLKPLLPGSRLERLSMQNLSPHRIQFEASLASEVEPGPTTTVPLATLFQTPEDLPGLVVLRDRVAPVPLSLCTQVTQTLSFEGLTPVGLVPRETAQVPGNPRHPIARSRWTGEGAFVRTLRGVKTLVAPGDWPGVCDELGAWLQDQGRIIVLMPQTKASP